MKTLIYAAPAVKGLIDVNPAYLHSQVNEMIYLCM